MVMSMTEAISTGGSAQLLEERRRAMPIRGSVPAGERTRTMRLFGGAGEWLRYTTAYEELDALVSRTGGPRDEAEVAIIEGPSESLFWYFWARRPRSGIAATTCQGWGRRADRLRSVTFLLRISGYLLIREVRSSDPSSKRDPACRHPPALDACDSTSNGLADET